MTETAAVVSQVRFDAATLGPYVSAAAVIHGRSASPTEVLETALALAVGAETMGPKAVQRIPFRTADVTGTLSIVNVGNDYRTQIGIATDHGIHGPDRMWTMSEDPAVALRTRAVLEGLVGERVTATKEGFYEYNADGSIKYDGTKRCTRTRLKPGSLHLITSDGEQVAVDLTSAPSQAATPRALAAAPANQQSDDGAKPAKPPYLPAAEAYAWLVERVGEEAAAGAWGGRPKTGPMARTVFDEIRGSVVQIAA
jgi:hypothetical protein